MFYGHFVGTPEVRGFEETLLTLCKEEKYRRKLESFFKNDKDETDSTIAPGNKSGGLTTNPEKSAGAVLKFGFNFFDEILDYGEIPNPNSQMIFMDSPGYDPCSITGQIASGATCLLFTTGRGSNYRNSFLPVIKVGSNSLMSSRMQDIIDIDAEFLLSSMDISEALISFIQAIREKINTKSLDFVHSDFVPWLEGGVN